ncbi:MAG: tail fiber domain-containing protein, partial [Bacteroidota bacterium]
ATAMGSRTTASGKYAFAAGDFSNASGDYSSSFGNYNYAPSYGEVAMGVFNVINIPFNTDDYDARDRLLVVGNGQSPTNRSNALVIYKSGNMELNGALTIDDAYTFPTTDGTTNQVLTTDGNGTLSWKDETANLKKLEDTDGDTKVQVEANSDEDIIRFALGGIEYMRLDSGRIEILNTGNSVFMGAGAGVNDNLTNNFNVFIGDSTGFNNISGAKNIFIGALSGYSNTTGRDNTFIGENAGYFNTSGEDNTFIGRSTGRLNTTGENNTFIGRAAGFKNSTGSNNIFIGFQAGLSNTTSSQNTYIGYQAGQNAVGESNVFIGSRAGKSETGSHKLYIENSDTASPLIYGDFLADSLQINGKLNINGGYTFPTADGSSGQFLQTDGSGNVSWTSQQTFTDTDNQTIDKLNLNGTTLELSLEDDGEGDQTVNLATLQDDLGDHNATQNIQLSGNWLSNDGGNEGLKIDNTGKVGIGTGSPGTLLDLGDGSGSNTVLLRLNTERSWQFEQTGSGANTNLRLKSNNAGKNYNIVSSDGSVIASFRADGGGNNNVGINKSIGTNDNALEVNGNASKSAAGDWLANSDARLKKNIQTLNSEQVLKQLLTLQGITYEWNDDKTGNDRPEGMQYGFTAQNVQEVFPTLVSEDSKGYLQTSYGTYDAMYVEALRALNEKIEDLERENEILKAQIAKVNQLEAMFHQLQAKMEADSDVMNATIAVKK